MSSASKLSTARRSGLIERLTSLLDAVHQAVEPPSYEAISAAASLPLSTTYRLLSTLVEQGWLSVDVEGRYALGWRSDRLGQTGPDLLTVRGAASEELLELCWQTDGVAHLTVLERSKVHYLDKISDNRLHQRVPSAVGAKIPACMTTSGQVLLTSLPTEWVARRHAEESCPPAQQDRLLRTMAETRRNDGIRAIPARLHPIGLANVAAPITGPDGAVAAISVAALSGDVDRIASLVREAAGRISDSLFGARSQLAATLPRQRSQGGVELPTGGEGDRPIRSSQPASACGSRPAGSADPV